MTADTTIGPTFVGRHSTAVHAVSIADETVLLHEPSGHLHLLNPSGSLVWRCLDGKSSLAQIGQDIADVAEMPMETVMDDITTLVAGLLDAGLVRAT